MNQMRKRIHSNCSSLCSNGKESKLGVICQRTWLVWEAMLHALQQGNKQYRTHTDQYLQTHLWCGH